MEVQFRHFLIEFCREVVDRPERALNLGTSRNCVFPSMDGELCTDRGMCNFATFSSSSFGKNVSSQRGSRTATPPATTLPTETYSSVTVITTFERAVNLDTCIICQLLSRDSGRRPECRKVQCHPFLEGLFRQEIANRSCRSENNHPVCKRTPDLWYTTAPNANGTHHDDDNNHSSCQLFDCRGRGSVFGNPLRTHLWHSVLRTVLHGSAISPLPSQFLLGGGGHRFCQPEASTMSQLAPGTDAHVSTAETRGQQERRTTCSGPDEVKGAISPLSHLALTVRRAQPAQRNPASRRGFRKSLRSLRCSSHVRRRCPRDDRHNAQPHQTRGTQRHGDTRIFPC